VSAFDGWLAGACALAGELAVYAGLAAGAAASGRGDVWALATGAAVLLGLRKVVRLCLTGPSNTNARAAGGRAARSTIFRNGIILPPMRKLVGGGRAFNAGIQECGSWSGEQVAQGRGPGMPEQGTGTRGHRDGRHRDGKHRDGRHPSGRLQADPVRSALSVLVGRLLALPAGERALVITFTAALYGTRITLLTLTGWGAVALAWAMVAGRGAGRYPRRGGRRGGAAGGGGLAAGVAGCRDDGPIAQFAGRVVHGQLVPLPPAVAGLIATVLLAALGLAEPVGPVLLTPVAAMLLAAPGPLTRTTGRWTGWPRRWCRPGSTSTCRARLCRGRSRPVTFGLLG